MTLIVLKEWTKFCALWDYKVVLVSMIYWILSFSAVFLFQIGNIYVANILFLSWVLMRVISKNNKFKFDTLGAHFFLFYMAWCIISTVCFAIQYAYYEVRNLYQLVYNLQYTMLIVDGTLDKERLRRLLYYCSYLLAFIIIGLWVTQTNMIRIMALIVHHREWAKGFVGGWPNTTVLPLVFGVFIEMQVITRERDVIGVARLCILLFALLLCTSRTGYVGAVLVVCYFLFSEREGVKPIWKVVKHIIAIIFVLAVSIVVFSIIKENDLSGRLFMVNDRLDIYKDAFNYVLNRPITGYGGNTMDVLYEIVGRTTTGINWGHTHNTIFELLIRYGFVGLIAFILLIKRVSRLIVCKDDKAMYWILWILSLFQIYYRDFVFLLILYSLIPVGKNHDSVSIPLQLADVDTV